MYWRKTFKILAPVSTVLRVVTPWFIFYYPILITILAWGLDWIDGELYYQWQMKRKTYNFFDKSLDLYWYFVSLIYAYLKLPYFQLLLVLFLIRFAGHVSHYLRNDDKYFMLFPNFYENIFTYIVFVVGLNLKTTYLQFPEFTYMVLFLMFLKLIQEIYAHGFAMKINDRLPEWMRGPDR